MAKAPELRLIHGGAASGLPASGVVGLESSPDLLGKYILDDAGNPVPERDVYKWGAWFQTHDRHVAVTHVGKARVSTVFLGFDHGFMTGAAPVLWETMVFAKGKPYDHYEQRYTTREDALIDHKRIVGRLRAVFSGPWWLE